MEASRRPRCRRQSGSGGRCKRSSFSGLSAAPQLGDILANLAFGIAGKLFAVGEIVERYRRPDADVRIERTQAQQAPGMAREVHVAIPGDHRASATAERQAMKLGVGERQG